MSLDLEAAARVAEAAAGRARAEILPRFRNVATETKSDGSPVTEADRAAEQAIREALRAERPDWAILGEEFGEEGPADGPSWVVDPIDGTIGFSRGIPLFGTIVALLDEGEPVLGLIDLPTLDERYVGWKGGGCRRNGAPVRVSQRSDLADAMVSHGDVFAFERSGHRAIFDRMAREIGMLRGYTDVFGHAQVLSGAVDAMVDTSLNAWDAAATQILVPEAGGRCVTLPDANDRLTLILGSPPLVERLADWFEPPA